MKNFDDIRYLQEGLYDPNIFKAFFLAGGPGSGKTFVTRNAFGGTGLRQINSDSAFERALKKNGLSLKMPEDEAESRDILRARAKGTTDKTMDLSIKGRLGMVIDGTGRDYDKIARQKAILDQLGYDCYMIFVNTSLDVALERNRNRPRSLPDAIIINSHKQIQKNMGRLQRIFGARNFVVVDNNEPAEDVNPTVNKRIRNLVDRAPTSYQAVKWIHRQLEKRKRK